MNRSRVQLYSDQRGFVGCFLLPTSVLHDASTIMCKLFSLGEELNCGANAANRARTTGLHTMQRALVIAVALHSSRALSAKSCTLWSAAA